MNLEDFNTLAEAQVYEQTTYIVIPSSLATSFFLTSGVEDVLYDNRTNPTIIDAGGISITIGSICRGTLANTTGFNLDPTNQLGQSNLALLNALVAIPLISQAVADQFIALSQTIETPYENTTLHEFEVAKGTVSKAPVSISANGDYAMFEISAETPQHNPRLTTAENEIVETFFNVLNVGFYSMKIPGNFRGRELFIDNSYSVVV